MGRTRHLFLSLLAAFVLVGGLAFSVTTPVFAQNNIEFGLDEVADSTGLPQQDIRVIIGNVISIILGFLGIAAVVIILYGGVLYMTAGGRDEQVEKAQKLLVNGAIGLVIILSAYAITRFVINTILDATGASTTSSSDGGPGGPGGPGSGFGSGFAVVSIVPDGAVPIRNVVVQINMSSNVEATSAADNIRVQAVGSTAGSEDGAISVSGSRITWRPTTPCPTPNESLGCLASDTAYDIFISGGLRGTNGLFVNCGFGGCNGSFTTGDLVDTTPPSATITYPTNNMGVSPNPDLGVTLNVTDDAGVGTTEVFVDRESIGTDAPSTTSTSFVADVEWSTTGLVLGSTHTIDAEVYDLAGYMVNPSSVDVIVRAEHCFDGIQNFSETGIDCGGDPASTDYCGACGGDACTTSADCSGDFSCVEGVCVALPQITQVLPDNGAPGNYVTVQGVNFGSATGEVIFLGDPADPSDDASAGLACGEGWSGSQVIVAVPPVSSGFPLGPIEIVTATGDSDRTDDALGTVMDFDVNTTVRPGLCSLSPNEGQRSSAVTVTGASLGDSTTGTLYFDGTSVSPAGISLWAATSIDALVPPIDIGVKDVTVVVGSESSNPIEYNVQAPAAVSGPTISYVSPVAGTVGSYITIFGANFGTSEGTVIFTHPVRGVTQLGDTDFPDSCTADTWSSGSITVKVPETYRDSVPADLAIDFSEHELTVTRADGASSEAVNFEVVSGTPGPGICGMSPASGPTGLNVNLFGENFGSTTDQVLFNGAATSAVTTLWEAEHVTATVPIDALTGEVQIQVGPQESNAVNFEVGACTPGPADSCESGFRCCANTLACTPVATPCEVIPPATNFLFEFSTGPIPVFPRVLQQCDENVISPSPWGNRSGGDLVCVNALVRADFNVAMDLSTLVGANIDVNPCISADPDDPCAELGPEHAGNIAPSATTFTLTPTVMFTQDTTYQVTITDDVKAAGVDGEFLLEPYIFTFTTRDDADPCDVEEVIVTPGRATLTEEGDGNIANTDNGDIRLQAAGLGDDACVLLSLTEPVAWTTANNSGPAIQLNTVITDDTLIDVQAMAETFNNAAQAIATLVSQGIFGESLISVNFTDPIVQNYWPNCQVACVNAQLGMQFNTGMDGTSLGPNTTVHLEQCGDELCLPSGSTPVTIDSILPSVDDAGLGRTWVIDPLTNLTDGAFYRVIVDNTVTSASGVPLTGLNYGNAFSWTFRVDPDGQLCSIDHVITTPDNITLQYIGQQQPYSVTPMGPPDDCSEFGQRLDGTDFGWDWSSTNTSTAFMVTNPSTGLLFDLGTPANCTDTCVLAGSQAAVGICGNGDLDYGEECDDSNTANGDGCSNRCLWEGTAACSFTCNDSGAACTTDVDCTGDGDFCQTTGSNCCGNGTQEPFEQCDDSNIQNGDGCSNICRNEGSLNVGAVCGNGAIAYDTTIGGESCDDGNRLNGDGCSAICLWEGSSATVTAQCGNGLEEGGEECDDGNATNGDGCSSSCLFEGGVSCADTVSGACCGDGVAQPGNFEQCDGGEGCSDSCLLLGSSMDYTAPSFCGDGYAGTGESSTCEASAIGDGRIDPFQIAEVSTTLALQSTPPADGTYSTQIIAEENTILPPHADGADLFVQCSCESSNDCSTITGGGYACGATSGCCVPRPSIPTALPVGSNVCRNAQVRVIFGELMDTASFADETGAPNIGLRLAGVSEADCTALDAHTYVAAESFNVAFLPDAVNRFMMQAWRWVRPEARALAAGCYLPTTPEALTVDGDHTEVILSYGAALEPTADYEIVIMGDATPLDATETGVRTALGAGFEVAQVLIPPFTTGTEICTLDVLAVIDPDENGYFSTANATHEFEAVALTNRGGTLETIAPITGLYDWTIDWSVADGSEILSLDDASGSLEDVSSIVTSGNENVTAIATITTDALNAPQIPGEDPGEPDGTEGRTVTGALQATVFICEVPWPVAENLPFSDTEGNDDNVRELTGWTNFATHYCRAEIAPEPAPVASGLIETAYAQTGVLPALSVTRVPVPSTGVEKEFILRHPTLPEAIGIRVFDNIGTAINGADPTRYDDPLDVPGFLSAQEWYEAQGFEGKTTDVEVDGYRGVADGRTRYIHAPSVDSVTGYLEPKIYAISYSEGAGPEIIDIYNQIVENFRFLAAEEGLSFVEEIGLCYNILSGDLMENSEEGGYYSCSDTLECIADTGTTKAACDATISQIRRDVMRIEDVRTIEAAVESYGSNRKHCSTTTNLVCVTDTNCPTNETCQPDIPLLDAGTLLRGWTTSAWPSWNAELSNAVGAPLPLDPLNAHAPCDGYDAGTCWNGEVNEYQCRNESHVYRYNRLGVNSYLLSVDMEMHGTRGSEPVWGDMPYPLTDQATYEFGAYSFVPPYASPWTFYMPYTCTGYPIGLSSTCGDGVLGTGEICEIGDTSQVVCDSDGDGVMDGVRTTACAAPENASSGFCSSFVDTGSECVPFSCGNGVIEGACLAGPFAGAPCLTSDACGAGNTCSFDAAVSNAETCDDGELNGLYGFCSEQCDYSTSALICGNGQVEGPEICDCGTDIAGLPASCSTINGAYDASGVNCAANCSGLGPRCGDGITNGGEQCDTESQTWAGALCVNAASLGVSSWGPCTLDSDCNTGETCGAPIAASSLACELSDFCVGGTNNDAACTTNADCAGGGVCTSFSTFRSRSCGTSSCTWGLNGGWSACEQQGSCGNGVLDGGEQCDDGNTNNGDGCTNVCQTNVCGDGFLNPAVESCDLGLSNGNINCNPAYGGTCNYCTDFCSYQTISGGFCGDGVVDVAGGEICDGAPPYYYVDNALVLHGVCLASQSGNPHPSVAGADCNLVGACNGGSNNGEICVSSSVHCPGGSCEYSECSAGCGTACPYDYESIYVQAQPWQFASSEATSNTSIPGAQFVDELELYSYASNGICAGTEGDDEPVGCQTGANCTDYTGVCLYQNEPNVAKVAFPDCRIGNQLFANVSYDITYPELDIVFVIDASASMNQTMASGITRWNAMKTALEEAIDTLYDDYPSTVRLGIVSFGGGGLDKLEGSQPYSFPGGFDPEQSNRDCPGEPYWNGTTLDYEWPAWDEIGDTIAPSDQRDNTPACIELAPTTTKSTAQAAAVALTNPAGNSTSGSATPTPGGMIRAKEILDEFPATNKRIVVLFSDGPPSCYHISSSASLDAYDPACTPIADSIYDSASELKEEGIDVYTAYFGADPETSSSHSSQRNGRMFQIFSSDCAEDWATSANLDPNSPFNNLTLTNGVRYYSRYAVCTATRAFSYYGDTPGAFEVMFESIIDNIINARLFFGNDESAQTSTLLRQGPGIAIDLPEDFVCPVPGGTVDVKMTFAGSGTVSLDNFQFQYCSE